MKGLIKMAKTIRGRVFNIMQYLYHPITGEQLIDLKKMEKTLKQYKTIKEWAWIVHDQDVWTEQDELNGLNNGRDWVKAGEKKPAHVHLVLTTGKHAIDVEMISRWLGIPSNFIDLPKGAGAFLDCIEYLTHESAKEQENGKHLYENELVHSNFDWRKQLDDRIINRAEYGRDLDAFEQMRFDVMYKGKTLSECEREDKIILMNKLQALQGARAYYLMNKIEPPRFRFNFYIEGDGSVGKGLLARGLARMFFPDIVEDDELFFVVGSENVNFEGYDGQPVIIWDDVRSFEMLRALGGYGNVYRIFDTHPVKTRQNVKYGSTMLANTINIVNSTQSYHDFLNTLAKAEDKKQSYRRFPYIFCLSSIPDYSKDFISLDFLINRGYAENTDAFFEYDQYMGMVCNLKSLENRYLPDDRKQYLDKANRQIGGIPKKVKETNEKHLDIDEVSDDQIDWLENFNKEILYGNDKEEKEENPDNIEGQITFDDIEKNRKDK